MPRGLLPGPNGAHSPRMALPGQAAWVGTRSKRPVGPHPTQSLPYWSSQGRPPAACFHSSQSALEGLTSHLAWTADPPSTCCFQELSRAPARICVCLCVHFSPSRASLLHGLASQTQATAGSPSEPLTTPRATGRGVLGRRHQWPSTQTWRGLGDTSQTHPCERTS